MKIFMGCVGGIAAFVGLVVLLGALGLGGRWVNLKVEGWFAPREADVQREVFENTKAYNEGKEQELLKTWKEYQTTKDEDTRAALRAYVTHAFADYPIDRLDPELQKFVRECRGL